MMDVEREKREKLAAARKKLNEYKMNRSGSSNSSSSQPADVPSFYQNLNTGAASVNIFNPVAGNNNVGGTNNPYLVAATEVVPTVTATGEGFTKTSAEPVVEHQQNFTFLPNQPIELSRENTTQTYNVVAPINLFSLPDTQPGEDISASELSENRQDTTVASFSNAPEPLFSSENLQGNLLQSDTLSDSPAAIIDQEKNVSASDNLQGDNSVMPVENVQSLDSVIPASSSDFSPSAPILDFTTSDENSKAQFLPADASLLTLNNEHNSTLLHETPQSEIGLDAPVIPPQDVNAQETHEFDATHGTSVPLFASSLFGPATTELDRLSGIFSVNENSQNLVLSNEGTTSIAEKSAVTEHVAEMNPLISPDNNAFFNPPFEIDNKLITDIGFSNSNNEESEKITEQALKSNSPTPPKAEVKVQEHNDVEMNIATSNFSHVHKDSSMLFDDMEQTLAIVTANQESSCLQHEDNSLQRGVQTDLPVSDETIQQMKSVQEAQEMQIEELRRENAYLLGRQTELTFRIEESEKLAHEFKLEKDRVREEATNTTQALRARINSLCEENQRIVKNSTDIGVDLRAKYEEKSKQLEEMQKAVIIVSQSKMDFAGKLDHELERVKELQALLKEKDDMIASLRAENSELQEKLKQDHQRDAVIHQLQDQARHYHVQCETLQREVANLRNKLRQQHDSRSVDPSNQDHASHSHVTPATESVTANVNGDSNLQPNEENDNTGAMESGCTDGSDTNHHHLHSGECTDHHHHHDNQEHLHEDCDHDHSGHHHHHHDHEEDHHHDHGHNDHRHHHAHDGDHDHSHEADSKVVTRREPLDATTELRKTLHRLEWENSSFRNEIDNLAIDAKQKRTYEEKCTALEEENARLKKEVEQLEHVIIQLQGENDTIGDYITLYQTQKMALKECAKEKDLQLEQLAREREMLLHRLTELTALVKDLKDSKSEAGSQCADDHVHTFDSTIPAPPANKRQIEGKIRDLLTEISSSSLIENFHPCAVCSGRLMTV